MKFEIEIPESPDVKVSQGAQDEIKSGLCHYGKDITEQAILLELSTNKDSKSHEITGHIIKQAITSLRFVQKRSKKVIAVSVLEPILSLIVGFAMKTFDRTDPFQFVFLLVLFGILIVMIVCNRIK